MMETIFPMTIAKYWTVITAFLAINAIFLVFFVYVVYKGTTFKKMFQPCHQIVIALLLVVFVGVSFWTTLSNKLLSPYKGGSGSRYYDSFKNSML